MTLDSPRYGFGKKSKHNMIFTDLTENDRRDIIRVTQKIAN